MLFRNARYYDPLLGRFLQPDWWEVRQQGVGTNRYAYSFNDPVNLSDPNGNIVCLGVCIGGGAALAAVIASIFVVDAVVDISNDGEADGDSPLGNPVGIATSAVVGAIDDDFSNARVESEQKSFINMDNNALIAIIENPLNESGLAANMALRNRIPIVSLQAQREFLVRGDPSKFLEFMVSNGGVMRANPEVSVV